MMGVYSWILCECVHKGFVCVKAFRDPLCVTSGMLWLKNLVELFMCVFIFVGQSSVYLVN